MTKFPDTLIKRLMTSYQGIGSNKSCICQDNSTMSSILNKAGFFIKKIFFEKLLIDMVMAPCILPNETKAVITFQAQRTRTTL